MTTENISPEESNKQAIEFQHALSTGLSENSFGNGSIDISLYRPNADVKYVDLLDIHYTEPNASQVLDMATSPHFSEGNYEYSRHRRRVSKKQATLLTKRIMLFINREFPNGIPADDEITPEMLSSNTLD